MLVLIAGLIQDSGVFDSLLPVYQIRQFITVSVKGLVEMIIAVEFQQHLNDNSSRVPAVESVALAVESVEVESSLTQHMNCYLYFFWVLDYQKH